MHAPQRSTPSGTGRAQRAAARPWLRKAGHAGLAQRLRRPGMADRALAGQGGAQAVEQGAEHGLCEGGRAGQGESNQYTRQLRPCPSNVPPPSIPWPPRAGSSGRSLRPPGCTRKWRGAWNSAWTGSCASRRAGCTGSRCAAACRRRRLLARRYPGPRLAWSRVAGAGARAGLAGGGQAVVASGALACRAGRVARAGAGRSAVGQYDAAHGGRSAGPDPALARSAGGRWLPDVFLLRARHPARVAHALPGAGLAGAGARVHRHARLGRHAGRRPALPSR